MRDQGSPAHLTALGLLGVYNVVQNTVVSERAYVPANLAATAGLLTLARRAGCTWEELGLAPATFDRGLRLGAGVGAGAAAVLAATIASETTRAFLLDDRAAGHTLAGACYRASIRFPIGTALFEEVAFRGVLEALCARRHGPATSKIVSAVSFGAWHVVPTCRLFSDMSVGSAAAPRSERFAAALGGAVVTTVAGVGFGWLKRRSQSVAAPWLAHAALNSLAYLAGRKAWKMESTAGGAGD